MQLRRLGLFEARVPRYTSYPTANHFSKDIEPEHFSGWLASRKGLLHFNLRHGSEGKRDEIFPARHESFSCAREQNKTGKIASKCVIVSF